MPSLLTRGMFLSFGVWIFLFGNPGLAKSASLFGSVQVESFSSDAGNCQEGGNDSSSSSTVMVSASCQTPGSHASASAVGTARADFGSLGVQLLTSSSTSATHPGSVETSDSFGSAFAQSFDTLTVSNASTSGFLRINFSVFGNLTVVTQGDKVPGVVIGESFTGIGVAVNNNVVWSNSLGSVNGSTFFGTLSPVIPFSFGNTPLNVFFSSTGRCAASRAGDGTGFSCQTNASFIGSAVVTGLEVLDLNQNLIPNAIVNSESGFNYQAGFPHTPTIPEPSTILLWGTGLAGLIGWRVKNPNMCRKRG
ncbi:MAG: PEP-CTERM sorting domain-containing protein [Nitrospira sp.]|nr:PEP-CTERM sorting domain-containing protein [Nitrospira sp.]